MPLALRAHSLWKSYAAGVAGCSARIWVLRGTNLEVHEGECVAILGARGAGISTLLHCLAGFRRLDAGTIEHARPPLLLSISETSTIRHASPRSDDVILIDETARPGAATPIPRVVHEPRECGVTMVIATHELSSVRHSVDRVLLLRDGHLRPLPLRSGSRRVAERMSIDVRPAPRAEAGESPVRLARAIEASRRRPLTAGR